MSRRKVVQLKLDFVNKKIKSTFRHNVIFCEKMNRGPNWVTDWNRKPKPKNLPSPEEAARMCAILQVQPEEILVNQEDVKIVQCLIDKERVEVQIPAIIADSRDKREAVIKLLQILTPAELDQVETYVQFLIAKRTQDQPLNP